MTPPPVFPAELAGRRQWLVWREVQKPGQRKPSKMPYYANGSIRGWPHGKPSDGIPTPDYPQVEQGDQLDRLALVTLDEALDAVARLRAAGVGFAFLPGDGLIGIDLDGIDQPERAELAQQIIAACGTYTEVSPSGSGVHIIGMGSAETIKSDKIGVECFVGRQFFTMTGRRLETAPAEVRSIPGYAVALVRNAVLAARDEAVAAAKRARQPAPAPVPVHPAQDRAGARPGGSVDRYVTAAFERAVERVRAAAEGGRNDTLNQEAYGLGRLLHTGLLAESRIVTALAEASAACGLPPGEAAATIRSGLRAGAEQPRVIEERFDRRAPTAPSWTIDSIDPDTGEIATGHPANDNVPGTYDQAAVDWNAPFLDTDNKGRALCTIENVLESLRRLRCVVRYDVISKEIQIVIPGEGFSIDNQANASLAWLTSALERFRVPTSKLGEYLTFIADKNPHNPVANWILSRPWDGTPRLQALMDTIRAEGEADPRVRQMKESLIRRWMISACAAAFRPTGVAAKGVLVLQGEQNLGKTSWFKALVPADLGVIADGLTLKPDDRDSVKQAVSYWMVELAELDATFRRADISALKAFLSRDRDVLRRAYARLESHYARRTVFFASVNPRQFLHDTTGNVRYWTICCEAIDFRHGLDMQQVWAEVYADHYQRGESWYLTTEEVEALGGKNSEHEVVDPIRERLQARYDWEAPEGMWRWLTATEIMLEIGFDRPTRADSTACGQYVAEMNGRRRRRSHGKNLLLVPPKSF